MERKDELVNGNGITWLVSKREEKAKERKPTSELAERLKTKSKELVKLFRGTATQTEDEYLPANKWQTAGEHSILQPVRSNRSALLRNSMPNFPANVSLRKNLSSSKETSRPASHALFAVLHRLPEPFFKQFRVFCERIRRFES